MTVPSPAPFFNSNWRGEKADGEGEQHEATERIDRYV